MSFQCRVAACPLRDEERRHLWASVSDTCRMLSWLHVPLGVDPREDLGYAGVTMALSWPGSLLQQLEKLPREREVWMSLLRLLPL